MKVLHVVQRYPPAIGGAESWCRGLARFQAARGDDVTVLTTRAVTDDDLWADPPHRPSARAVGATDVDGGVHVVRCPVAAPLGPAGQRMLPRLGASMLARAHSPELYGRLLHRARSCDVVHAHAVPGPHVFAAWIATRLARRPLVLTPFLHAGDEEHESRAVGGVLRSADALVAMTRAEADALAHLGVAPSRITVATNAIDGPDGPPPDAAAVRAALGIANDRPLIVFVGRKSPTKGIDVLLDAHARLAHVPAPVLVLVGPTTAWFRGRLVPSDGVHDLPPLSERDKVAVIAASDVLVLPSAHESFGGVFLDAWSAGIPVIGADIPSVREVIGDAGFLFRAGDAADLAARIEQVLRDPGVARAAAKRGRTRLSSELTWARVGAAVDTAYAQARAGRAARGARSVRSPSWG